VAYLEKKQGLPAGDYSEAFLEIDQESGPWLTKCQTDSPIARAGHKEWDLDLERGLIRFTGGEGHDLLARFEVLGTFNPEDGTWLWAWSNPMMEHLSAGVAGLRETFEKQEVEIPEITEPNHVGTEVQAWTLAAAAAFRLQAESCYRLPGDIQTFVALYQITELPNQGEAPASEQQGPDPEAAAAVLAEYAGPMALNLGGLLIGVLRGEEELSMDQLIGHLHSFCDNLAELAKSDLGQGTPAAAEAVQLSNSLRQSALFLSVPPGSPLLDQAVREVLTALRGVAEKYGALEGEGEAE